MQHLCISHDDIPMFVSQPDPRKMQAFYLQMEMLHGLTRKHTPSCNE